jgi:hypothetical protein
MKAIRLIGVESFVLPGGWHLISHYLITTDSDPALATNIKATKWVNKHELAEMRDIAHGQWEVALGLRFLAC